MFKHFIKIIICSLLISNNAMAKNAFVENQGEKPKSFDPALFSGQWLPDSSNIKIGGLSKRTKFTEISDAYLDEIDKTIKEHKNNGNRKEKFVEIKAKKIVDGTLYMANNLDLINKTLTPETLKDRFSAIFDDKARKQIDEFYKNNEGNGILFRHYNQSLTREDIKYLLLFDFLNLKLAPEKNMAVWEKAIKKAKKEMNFDFRKEVDFFMINKRADLYAIDYVDKDSFILYDVKKLGYLVFVRNEKPFKSITTEELFKKIEDRNKEKEEEEEEEYK